MKNISLALNIVLAIAVAVLYYLHFKGGSCCKNEESAVIMPKGGSSAIAFINTDTLLNHYEYYKQLKSSMEEKARRSESEMQGKMTALQAEAQVYQQKGASMTMEQRAATEEGLMKKQQQLMQRKEELGQQLAEEEQKLVKDLYEKLTGFLKKANADKGFQYVLSKNGPILLANDSLDITKQVIEGLNKDFEATKKK